MARFSRRQKIRTVKLEIPVRRVCGALGLREQYDAAVAAGELLELLESLPRGAVEAPPYGSHAGIHPHGRVDQAHPT